ncbi:pilus assembly protein TadG-related protein [Jatrophihabitans sp. YIM 134969]
MSLYVVAITVGLLALAGLVIDGGSAIAAREQAADTAQQAARAGADALSQDSLRDSGGLFASPAAATRAANEVLSTGGVTGTVLVAGDQVTVSVVVHRATAILSALGISELTGSATESATAVRGTTTGGA